MKPIRGPIVDRSGRVELPMDFAGSAPTPSGEPVWVEGSAPDSATRTKPAPFFAYSTTPLAGTMRIFVFPPPMNAVLLDDDAVSWHYQRPMKTLSEQEVEQEMAYRRKLGLHVPLDQSSP
jgi:hypothetical protein